MRQTVHSRWDGYKDLNDDVCIAADPKFYLLGSKKDWHCGRALTFRLQTEGRQ